MQHSPFVLICICKRQMAVGLTGQIFEEDYLQQFKQAVCKEMRQKCVPVWQDEQAKMIRENGTMHREKRITRLW